MKRSQFRLDKFLKYQKSLLWMIEVELLSKNRQCTELTDMITEYQLKKRAMFHFHGTGLEIQYFRQAELYRENLSKKIEHIQGDLLIVEQQKNEVQRKYITHNSKCRALELLKEKELSQYKRKMIRYSEGAVGGV